MFTDPTYASVFTGQVAVVTCFANSGNDPVLGVIDLKNQATAPLDTNYVPPMYHGPSGNEWTKNKLGNVFGLTLDDTGNIYVAATSSYQSDFYPSGKTGGEVYKIDATTGGITTFATLPNSGPGLGNVTYDCATQNFYVTNFDDGQIYRLSSSGTILDTWDHGINLPTATPPSTALPDDTTRPFTQLGRRLWGVQTLRDRLYYSVWRNEQGHQPPCSSPPNTMQNEIWSVQLTPSGSFIPGTAKLEILLPVISTVPPSGPPTVPAQSAICTLNFSNPVSDITFSPNGTMLLAERGMADATTPAAHRSRVLEYTFDTGINQWITTTSDFEIGVNNIPSPDPPRHLNSAGGVDYDFGPNGRAWVTGDALHFKVPDSIYGLQGIPPTGTGAGGGTTTSILIDLNGLDTVNDKTDIGDVEIPCPNQASATGCCGEKPNFSDPAFSSVFTGQVAVVTCLASQLQDPVLAVIDLKNQATAPLNTNYAPPMYHGPIGNEWTKQKLGNIFGLTLDNSGNIYVTSTTAYFFDFAGPAGFGGIYKIDGVTGAITTFSTLPNTGAGLGNITYDCTHQKFYVTNHDDGLIYRLSPGGATLSSWDHGVNLPTATPPSAATPDDPTQAFTPLGRRVWGVQSFNGRLYYGVWWEDLGRPDSTHNNEVWSVALDNNGEFIAGTAKLEIAISPLANKVYSNPVSDISFGPQGTMLLAERSMSDDTNPSAHQSRVLEYELISNVWTPTAHNFAISQASPPGSAAGGVDYDFGPGGLVWVTADAIHLNAPDNIYGLQGLPVTGGSITDSILIDLDNEITQQDKFGIGDVEIPCPPVTAACTINCPDDIVVSAQPGKSDVVISYSPPITTGSCGPITCTPPSNSPFQVGVTTVTCNSVSGPNCSFTVTVKAIKCDTICFRSPQYWLLNLSHLPKGTVLIAGVNGNQSVSTSNVNVIGLALKGNALGFGTLTPQQQFNQEFVAAQLNFLAAGGSGSPVAYNAMWANLSCYGIKFNPVTLSNGVILTVDSMVKELWMQATLAAHGNNQADFVALAAIFDLLNGNSTSGLCN